MKLKSIEEFIKYINNNKLTDAQESYIRGTIVGSYDEIKNETNRLTR